MNQSEQDTRRQIHTHAHTLDMESLMLKEAGFTGKVRDIIDAVVGAAGTRVSPQMFEMDHLTLARRLNHPGARGRNKRDKKAAITYVSRKLNRLEQEMKETGYMVIRIVRGHEEQRTRYEVFLTPLANKAYQRAFASDLWKEHPGKAKSAQVEQAIAELPHYESKGEETKPKGETEEKMIARNLSTIKTLAQKTFEAIARTGDSPTKHCQELESALHSLAQIAEHKAKGTGKRYVIKRDENLAPQATEGGIYKNVDTPTPTKPDMKAEAHRYAQRGLPVFQVKPDKRPLTRHGFKDATTNEAQIEQQWSKRPNAGIAIPTGELSGWLVLDEDMPYGSESRAELEREYGKLPETLEAETPSGGRHKFFKYPKDSNIRNSAGQLGAHLDVRAQGGYAVVAPSLDASGKRYLWLNNREPAELPESWLKLLTEKKTAVTTPSFEKPHTEGQSASAIEGFIPYRKRNISLFKIASRLRGDGAEYEEIVTTLYEVFERRCEKSPPMEPGELEKIAGSTMRYSPNSAKSRAAQ